MVKGDSDPALAAVRGLDSVAQLQPAITALSAQLDAQTQRVRMRS